MASYTTNLNLKKPAGSENVAIGDINGNMDTIDTAFGSLKIREENILAWGTYGAGTHQLSKALNAGDQLVLLWGSNGRYRMTAAPTGFSSDELCVMAVPNGQCFIRFSSNSTVTIESSTESLRSIARLYITP